MTDICHEAIRPSVSSVNSVSNIFETCRELDTEFTEDTESGNKLASNCPQTSGTRP